MHYRTVPAHIVSQIVAAHPVTRDELNALRDPRRPSRYCGVYASRHGGAKRSITSRYVVNSYRARIYKFFELGSNFPTAEDAARAIAAWYKAHYGEKWPRIFRYRQTTPWRLRTLENGYAVDIYVRGCPVRVTHADVYGRSAGASERFIWETPEQAKLAARLAMDKRFERELPLLLIPARAILFWRG